MKYIILILAGFLSSCSIPFPVNGCVDDGNGNSICTNGEKVKLEISFPKSGRGDK